MRIIAGLAKSRRLRAPDTPDTRPATDRVREAVFSAIGTWVEEARVLDLYAGSGSYGLEALSRGAESAVFVEKGRTALVALRSNVDSIGLGGTIVATSVEGFLSAPGPGTYHLVFIDPPWELSTDTIGDQLSILDEILEPNGEVVVSRRHGDAAPRTPHNWSVLTDRRYGDARIYRYGKPGDEEQ